MIAYPMLIHRNESGDIISIHFPDLRKTFNVNRDELAEIGIVQIAQRHLENYVKGLENNNFVIPTPQKLKEYRKCPVAKYDIWTKIYIDYNPNKGCWEKALPIIGNLSTLISAGCYAVTTFMSIELTTGTSLWSKFLSGFGSAVGLLFTYIIYMYSGATNDLSHYGKSLDNNSKHTNVAPNVEANLQVTPKEATRLSSVAKIFLMSVLYPLVLLNTIANSITIYQETKSVGDRAGKEDHIFSPSFVLILALVTMITNAISVLTFEASFAKKVVIDIPNRLQNDKTQSSTSTLEHNPLENVSGSETVESPLLQSNPQRFSV